MSGAIAHENAKLVQNRDGKLGGWIFISSVLIIGLGRIFSFVGLTQAYWSSLAGSVLSGGVGFWLTSVGTHKPSRSVWLAVFELTPATKRVTEEWTPSQNR